MHVSEVRGRGAILERRHQWCGRPPVMLILMLKRRDEETHSAMSMLTLYINRAGENLSVPQKRVLEAAKVELRRLFVRPVSD
jgi:hypothetical protein